MKHGEIAEKIYLLLFSQKKVSILEAVGILEEVKYVIHSMAWEQVTTRISKESKNANKNH